MKIVNLHDVDQEEVRRMQAEEEHQQKQKINDRFQRRFEGTHLPFVIRHKDTAIISKWLSYFFQLLSIAGLWYAVKVVLEFLPVPYLNYVIASVLLLGFEIIKRKFSDRFWDHWAAYRQIHMVNFSINFLLLFSVSMGGTLYGLYYAAKDGAPEAKYIGASDDPAATATLSKLEIAKKELEQFNSNPSNYVGGLVTKANGQKGQVYYKKLDMQTKLEQNVLNWESQLQNNFGIITVENEDIKQEWKSRTQGRIYAILFLAFLCELLFESCMRFNSLYDYQLYKTVTSRSNRPRDPKPRRNRPRADQEANDRAAIPSSAEDHTSSGSHPVATAEVDLEVDTYRKAYKKAKSDRDAWRSKNRAGKGTETTNNTNIARLEKEMLAYQAKLTQLGATV